MVTKLHFGQRYRVIREGVIASQFNRSRTALVTERDLAIPVGTVFILGDAFEWNEYSAALIKSSLNPNFYDIAFEESVAGFVSQNVAVLAHVLEQSVEEITDPTLPSSEARNPIILEKGRRPRIQ
jgi:hypothetical protein